MEKRKIKLPAFLKSCFWSYDLERLDSKIDFIRIGTNILIYGDLQAVKWLFDNYEREEIITLLTKPQKGEWDAKSLNFWSKYLGIQPDVQKALKSTLV